VLLLAQPDDETPIAAWTDLSEEMKARHVVCEAFLEHDDLLAAPVLQVLEYDVSLVLLLI